MTINFLKINIIAISPHIVRRSKVLDFGCHDVLMCCAPAVSF